MGFEHCSSARKSNIQPLIEAGPNVYFSKLHAPYNLLTEPLLICVR
jgi:hypothetical protein